MAAKWRLATQLVTRSLYSDAACSQPWSNPFAQISMAMSPLRTAPMTRIYTDSVVVTVTY
ncbi:hypothetical protein [Mesorhizobium sp. RIZ17]|uniref:hypothetical protein n=1 Tax=Mesorhizobium sp. RIZ17 TaxID=3132743 RepID=UPI003DAA2037